MDRDDVGGCEEFLQRNGTHVEQAGVFVAQIGVANHDVAAERFEEADDAAADHAGRDDADFFGVEGVAKMLICAFPAALLFHHPLVAEEVALSAQHRPQGVFCH